MADLINPMSGLRLEEDKPSGVNVNFAALEEGSQAKTLVSSGDDEVTKKRGRPPKQKTMTNGAVMYPAGPQPELTMLQSNEPYINTFGETNMLLRGTIVDVDTLNGIVKEQLDAVVESKTLRKKYDYISELSSTSANLIGTKLRSISEMNKVISDAHKLDLQRAKELKLATAADNANDDKRMMDMYAAFINTPVGTYGGNTGPQFPNMNEITMTGSPINGIDMSGAIAMAGVQAGADPGYNAWQQQMSPETNRMVMEKLNPNVQTVVVYDQTTNNKYFDVVDRATGQSVPNMPKPDAFLLADTYPNLNNHTARNSNIDAVYPLVVVGQPESYNDF